MAQARTRRRGGSITRAHPPGPIPKLTAEQRAPLPTLLAPGAEAYGFLGDVWTTKRVAALIKQEFGIQYHPAPVSRLLRAVGWSPQKPIRRATQRDEAAIERWTTERWPALQAKPRRRGARGGAARIWPERLPAYAPELNPDESIWNLLQRVELRNLCCNHRAELRLELRLAVARLRHKRGTIRGCIGQCGYAASQLKKELA